jgi:hypothetical protein
MRKTIFMVAASLILSAAALCGGSPRAEEPSSTAPVTTVVTVLGPNFSAPPALAKDDIAIYSKGSREDVNSWVPAQGDKAGLQLAILIDDADSISAIGEHFSEIKDFITSQPSTTQVGIFYARNGAAVAVAPFSADHEAVAQKLRLPLGRFAGASPSIYFSLEDLISHWPVSGTRREVVMITSGIDYLYPGIDDPYVDAAIRKVQASGVIVYTIYTGGPRLAATLFLQQIAWGNLVRVADGSGGQGFFQGFETPVNFVAIFQQLDAVLRNQYLLTFTTPRPDKAKGELRSIQVRTEVRKVKLYYPSEVSAPGE